MAIEHMRTWKIGDVEVTRIVEVNAWEDDITMLLPDATPATVQAYPWLAPHYATPAGKMLISFQCFVMKTKTRKIMLDTCIGNDRHREFPVFTNMQTSFLGDLAHAGFKPEEIDCNPAGAGRDRAGGRLLGHRGAGRPLALGIGQRRTLQSTAGCQKL